jgi:hypothetical protein
MPAVALLFAVALLAVSALPHAAHAQASLAGPTPTGRYAPDAASCRGGDIFATVAPARIDLPTLSCMGVRYDMQSSSGGVEMWQVEARSCVEEGQTRGKPMRFRIERREGRVRFLWADGERSGRFVRCGG